MRRSFKFRLYPNVNQTRELASSLETHRRIYNAALAERKERYEKDGETLRLKHQYPTFAAERNRQVADEKAGGNLPHWYAHVSAVSMRDTIKRLDKAFDAFFRRIKEGGRPGYPRFRGRDRYDSIPFDNYNSGAALVASGSQVVWGDMAEDAELRGHKLRLFGVGAVRVKTHRPVKGKIKTVIVKREADKWYVVFSCDLGDVNVEPSTLPPVGIDVGLESFLTTSEGEHEPNPRYLNHELPELRRKQRVASRRFRKGKKRSEQSKRFRKAQRRVAKLHQKVKNLRKEHHHQTALKLVRRFGVVCVESLNIRGMLRNDKLARSIGDAAWGGFLSTLKSKAESAGVSVVEVDPKYTSQTCSACGHCEAANRPTQARFCCLKCGHTQNADHNAARNILARGQGRTGPTPLNVAQWGERAARKACLTPEDAASARGAGKKARPKASKDRPLSGGSASPLPEAV